MAYFRDWFGRDADYGYSYYDPAKRTVSWDKGYTNYSDFFFGGGASSINMEEAASLIRTMSQVMGVDTTKFSAQRNADGIQLPAQLLKEHGTDIFIGASLQNMAKHVHQNAIERAKSHKYTLGSASISKLVNHTLNEERVNKLMSEETPGYLRFIEKYKKHKYKDRPVPTSDNEHLLDLFDRIMRYPENITEEELEKFKEPIENIKKILAKSGGVPTDFTQCAKVSRKISSILEKYIKEEESESKSDGDGDGDGDDESDDSKSMSEGGSGGDKDGSGSSDSAMKKAEEYVEKMMKASKEEVEKGDDTSFQRLMEEMKSIEELESKGGALSKVDYVHVQANRTSNIVYEDVLKKIDMTKASVLGTLLRRKNRDYQFSLRSMRSGRLDTNKLAEAVQGVPTIYERIGQVKTNKLCVTVLVDESGSMHGSKAAAAREAAIFLNEALKDVRDVELFIYGHTADWRGDSHHGIPEGSCSGYFTTQLLIYREPGYQNTTQMGHISGKYENRDGSAIIAAAKRVRSMTQNQGIFVVISDGSPHANGYSGEKARKHTQRMANETEALGFEVIQVTIGGYRSKDMFKNVINMDTVSKFPDQFVGFLKRKINTLIKEKVTL